jgi:hypothetical protein
MSTFTRFLHIVALVYSVGGQLMLVVAEARQSAGMRTPCGGSRSASASAARVALAVLIGTGAAMASHLSLWSSPTLHAKLGLLVLVRPGRYVLPPRSRALSYATLAASLLIVWLGVKLTYG